MKIQEKKGKLNIVDFNEAEAYKIACKIEEDGIHFYQNILGGTKNKYVKEKISYLLEEEKKHLKFFNSCLFKIGQEKGDDFEEDNLFKYLDYGIFKPYQDLKDLGSLIDDINKALDLGILIEDKSIKLYEACKDKVSSSKTKKELGNIIEEEKRHRLLLEEMLNVFKT